MERACCLFVSTVIYTHSRLERRLAVKKEGPPLDWVQWVNASGCRSHYQQGLVVGNAVREPEYCFQGWIHTFQDVKVPGQSLRNYCKIFSPYTVRHKKSVQKLWLSPGGLSKNVSAQRFVMFVTVNATLHFSVEILEGKTSQMCNVCKQ